MIAIMVHNLYVVATLVVAKHVTIQGHVYKVFFLFCQMADTINLPLSAYSLIQWLPSPPAANLSVGLGSKQSPNLRSVNVPIRYYAA